MSTDSQRTVSVERIGARRFHAHNARGGELVFGEGEDADFTPVELLLTALAGCSAIDVDYLTSRRAEPERFVVRVSADKRSDEAGNHLAAIEVQFQVTFPDGPAGDQAREVLPVALQRSHDRLCTVSQTVERGTPVSFLVD